ncbi:UPF0220-domain-containing protein [Microstroma glucosiphilum]|uniref:UPF0220-domain-containing protein n=1 Tax=Pseudomicrostroma glucosiphilum TaxID=1684307 RepID=A0A316U9R2_9BASI|nr:UPF0220-domain-containing protein [Pseudomicrostroma glucosiphilum]PWN21997.1 UPF0220-domain-containing protein [Pseudomicrostroma glucosiphilum]
MSYTQSQARRGYGGARRACLIPIPSLPAFLAPSRRTFGIYLSGALFSIGWWFFLDAVISSSILSRAPPEGDPKPWTPPDVAITFADWIPGLCGTFGMIVVNLIDKSLLAEAGLSSALFSGGMGGGSGGGDATMWRAKLFLFVGFALMAGGLAGSVTVLVVKYVVPGHPEEYGVANVIQVSRVEMQSSLAAHSRDASQLPCRPANCCIGTTQFSP